jgi:hypothetical protein
MSYSEFVKDVRVASGTVTNDNIGSLNVLRNLIKYRLSQDLRVTTFAIYVMTILNMSFYEEIKIV